MGFIYIRFTVEGIVRLRKFIIKIEIPQILFHIFKLSVLIFKLSEIFIELLKCDTNILIRSFFSKCKY